MLAKSGLMLLALPFSIGALILDINIKITCRKPQYIRFANVALGTRTSFRYIMELGFSLGIS
jgi:hypothetical protein